jgi:hypothetical protein
MAKNVVTAKTQQEKPSIKRTERNKTPGYTPLMSRNNNRSPLKVIFEETIIHGIYILAPFTTYIPE